MSNVKVSILGSDGYICQIPRIKEGMLALGHILSEDSPDLIYSNDPPGYEKALSLKKKYPNACLILNFLDIPWHFPGVEEKTKLLAKHFFSFANVVTTISYKVKKDLSKFYSGRISVIYNPIKDVQLDENIKKDNDFLFVGRVFDKVKRFYLVHDSLLKIKNGEKRIKVCGLKNPGFGEYLGVVDDQKLNTLYNSSKYVLLPSSAEGLGLPMIESMICGAIPITCSDNLTAREFSPLDFICEPNAEAIVKKVNELNKNYEKKRKLALEYGEKYKKQFDKKTIAQNIIDVFLSKKKENEKN